MSKSLSLLAPLLLVLFAIELMASDRERQQSSPEDKRSQNELARLRKYFSGRKREMGARGRLTAIWNAKNGNPEDLRSLKQVYRGQKKPEEFMESVLGRLKSALNDHSPADQPLDPAIQPQDLVGMERLIGACDYYLEKKNESNQACAASQYESLQAAIAALSLHNLKVDAAQQEMEASATKNRAQHELQKGKKAKDKKPKSLEQQAQLRAEQAAADAAYRELLEDDAAQQRQQATDDYFKRKIELRFQHLND